MIILFILCAVIGSLAGSISENSIKNGRISFKVNKKSFLKFLPVTLVIVAILYIIMMMQLF
ncbi:hypothetical protein [Apilactobacillus xinyiensis]|uniref:Uncharacterized protein n=1 Tax=Apilactobacillus xinyiensis TaxID=2841032 RepID=A0ABT0I3C9_9LACO|nr:hypothetical protein [Apilactobacillus xinyiensis]MCK8625191.1 hypothetical protein [Apilactobacillus xinyiensis]MCL0319329.1 hypothetical protein [Apilactobacillus xinyiensis]